MLAQADCVDTSVEACKTPPLFAGIFGIAPPSYPYNTFESLTNEL